MTVGRNRTRHAYITQSILDQCRFILPPCSLPSPALPFCSLLLGSGTPWQKQWLLGNFEGLLKRRGTREEDNKLLLFLKEKPTSVLLPVPFKTFREASKRGAELRPFWWSRSWRPGCDHGGSCYRLYLCDEEFPWSAGVYWGWIQILDPELQLLPANKGEKGGQLQIRRTVFLLW